ncbi:hypothetical protein OIU84_009630 [Salix udensis]|uniref:EF-hand domain-containing protein n=1 Tax=Salix udensis TaxID=889485 RepID=A0AAD6JS47_9ROSI|nr:hypothetical protein OIU84_009630 [Salix udensis]
MSFFSRKKRSSSSHAPSAPSLPESYDQRGQTYSTSHQSNYSQQQQQQPYYGQGSGGVSSYGYSGFPPGTSPDIIRSFEMVDRDRSGFIDENELQQAISSGYQRFNIRTVRLLMFLFKNPNDSLRCGPKEFAALWSCLGQWRVSCLFLFLLSCISFLYIAFKDVRHLKHSMPLHSFNTEERLNTEEY